MTMQVQRGRDAGMPHHLLQHLRRVSGAELHPVGFLLLLASGRRVVGEGDQREMPAASPRLDRAAGGGGIFDNAWY